MPNPQAVLLSATGPTAECRRPLEYSAAGWPAVAFRYSCAIFPIVVADDWQNKGLGTRLMQALMSAARGAGLRVMRVETEL